MRFFKRTWVKWILRVLCAAALLLGLYLSIFFIPYPLFPHHLKSAGFSVYSDDEIQESFNVVLEEARSRVEAMPLYRAEEMPRIFICRSHRLFTLLVKLAGKRYAGQGLLVSVAGNAFLSEHGIQAVAQRNADRSAHSRLEGSLAAAIAHEVAHHLMFIELGYRGVHRIPPWKSEGYADYTANLFIAESDPGGEIVDRICLLLDDSAWQGSTGTIDRRHFRWQVLVEFLCEIGEMDLAGILTSDVTEAESWTSMMTWYREYNQEESMPL